MKRFVTTCLILILMAFTSPIVYAQTTTEIEFWQRVKDGDDIDMLKAYLQEYPDGKFRSLAILKIKKLGGTVTSPKKNKTEVKPSATTIMADKSGAVVLVVHPRCHLKCVLIETVFQYLINHGQSGYPTITLANMRNTKRLLLVTTLGA